ncbi:MAG: protein-disulfide reductase DsbD domain-containing protein [Verrucomicrobiota bacterium]
MRRIGIILSGWLCLLALTVNAAHTQVQLLLSADTVRPGDTIWAGVDMKMDPDWHTYWKNPGEAGMATEIKWQLPPGVTAGETQWPLPEKLPPAEVTTYGYNREVVLLVPLTLASNSPAGPLDLKANVTWLECKEECVPGSASIEATLNVSNETRISADAATIDSWKSKTPQPGDSLRAGAWWKGPANGDTRPLILGWSTLDKTTQADFFPHANANFDVQAATDNLPAGAGKIRLGKTVQKFSGDWPKEIGGVAVMEISGQREGFEVKMPVSEDAPAAEIASESGTGVAPVSDSLGQNMETGATPVLPPQPLWKMLLYAFIGGLILNIMPCVLPVIALKILGFINHAQREPGRVRVLGLVYAAGVLVSFLVLAAVVIGVKAAGHHAGWGMQFGSPVFIVVLTSLITLVALNLFGIFDVTLGGQALSAAGQLASKQGAPGAFFNGLLATALATPCTAPFLAPALGFAFAQSPSLIVLIFLFVGLGLAAPYIVLSWNPAWMKFLPKPGPWMEKFKIAMGFPMLLTAVWLFNLAADDYGTNVLWLGVFLVLMAFAAWIFGSFVQRGRTGKGVALAIVLILLIGGYAFALENQLHWREPMTVADSTATSPDGIDWQTWSPDAVAKAQSEGHPVLVDFTANWCLTCQVNKKIAIDVSSVRAKLKEINAVALVGDYTHFPDNITAELNRYGRAGVPLVLVYPKEVDTQPIVLPALLTPGVVLDALDQAAK